MVRICQHCQGDGCEYCDAAPLLKFSGSVFIDRCVNPKCFFEGPEVIIEPERITSDGVPSDPTRACPMCGASTEWAYLDEA